MALHEHISANTVERYERRSLSPGETLRFQTKVFECEDCRQLAAMGTAENAAFTDVFNQFADSEFDHLEYQQLASFVDQRIDPIDREIVESHLAVCMECSGDLADLRAYRQIAVSAPAIAASDRTTIWQRLGAFGTALRLAPVVAVLLLVIGGAAWFLTQRPSSDVATANANLSPTFSPVANLTVPANTAPVPDASPADESVIEQPAEEGLIALSDGPITVDKSGELNGLENLSPATRQAIRQGVETGKVRTAANSLGGSTSVLMSEGSTESGVPFALETPVGRVTIEDRPQLRWKPLKGATGYQVAVVDDKFRIIETSGQLTTTSWQPSKPLPRGTNYSWQVTATLPDGSKSMSPASPAPQARFRVVERDIHDDIQTQLRSDNPSHLALGVAYARAGLKQEARREFEKLVKQNPDSQIARRLLRSMR
jgi:hypothetical protein